ncbi:MAG: hypothetical protein M0D55_09900 [Elusimicrobiota bacterium]|nr:MAG: hypothetical protein M0D55_09900 [Elusimicrobiota bacterium]
MRVPVLRRAILLSFLALAPGAALGQTFTGDFSLSSGAVYQTAAIDEARGVAVDTVTAGGPFVYVTGESGSVGATIKLSSAGVMLTSAAISGVGARAGASASPWTPRATCGSWACRRRDSCPTGSSRS